jgi:hypothetical protein
MKCIRSSVNPFVCVLSIITMNTAYAQQRTGMLSSFPAVNAVAKVAAVNLDDASSGCNTVNGTQFNLEPALNAQPQNSESLDFLLNGAGSGVDLVVGAANESDSTGLSRFVPSADQEPNQVLDAFYVHRSGTACNADFEGTTNSAFPPTINPKVVADPARGAFFLAADIIAAGASEYLSRTTSANLLSTTVCPNGTELVNSKANVNCWPTVSVIAFNGNENAVVLGATVAVDPRTTGTGAGDVIVAGAVDNIGDGTNSQNVQVVACTNVTLACSSQVAIASGSDTTANRPWVQVRQDGLITISYWAFTKPNGTRPNPVDVKFVTCTPQGAPKAPVCGKPVVVSTLISQAQAFDPGDNDFEVQLAPKHANRRESDGSFTTFLVYDRCRAILSPAFVALNPVCSKVDLLLTTSTNNGDSWAVPTAVESAVGHQYFGTIKVDESTGITNVAYYSSQNDPFLQRSQIFLSQIPAGSTTVDPPHVLTSASTDLNVGIQNLIDGNSSLEVIGTGIGLSAAGTGTGGQSKAYVHFTSANVFGSYNETEEPHTANGTKQPSPSNTLVPFSY